MLKILVKIKLKCIFDEMFTSSRKGNGTGKILLLIGFAIYMVVVFGGLLLSMFANICDAFIAAGIGWLYFGFAGVMIFFLGFIGSVFVTQNLLYKARDNDLLMAMPIKPGFILLSRIISLLIINYILEIFVLVPCVIIYVNRVNATLLGMTFLLITFAILPLFIVVFSAIFGWIVAFINSKLGNNNMFTMLLTLALFMGYMYMIFSMQEYMGKLIEEGQYLGEVVRKVMPPFYYMGDAVYNENALSLIKYILWVTVPFVILYNTLSATFIKIATTTQSNRKIVYKEKAMRVKNLKTALILKEIRHFLGSPMYMFNNGVGLLFIVIGAGYVLYNKSKVLGIVASISGSTENIGAIIAIGFALMGSMVIISSASISIEGRNLWITQSAPIREKDALLAKVYTHIIVTLPFLIISQIMVIIALKPDVISILFILIVPIVNTAFNAFLGLALNLKYPKFDWVNETAAAKNGLSPTLTMFLSASIIMLPMLMYMFIFDKIISANVNTLIILGINIFIAIICYHNIANKGSEKFRYIQE